MTLDELVAQSNRLILIAAYWHEQVQLAFARQDVAKFRVARLAHSMADAAHRNLLHQFDSTIKRAR